MGVQTNGELKKHVDRRDLAIFGNPEYPASPILQMTDKMFSNITDLKMSGVIKGETVNANELV